MTEWYYADANQQQQGPVSAQDIRALYQKGALNDQSMVWREGMEGWQPLFSQSDALELVSAAAPVIGGIDLRRDIQAIEDGTAPLPGNAGVMHAPPSQAHSVDQGGIVHAGLWRRFAANCIDSLVTGVLSYVLIIPLALMFGLSASTLMDSSAGTGASMMFLILQWAISLGLPAVYFAWMHSSSHQASLGKMAVGIKVARPDGQALGFARALGRYAAYTLFVVFTCGLGVLISGLMVAFSERKQALHDMICDSIVVDRHAFTDQPELQKTGLDTVTIIVLVLFGLLAIGGILAAIAVGAAYASMAS